MAIELESVLPELLLAVTTANEGVHSNPIAIRITPKEKESGHLTLQHLQTAVIAIHEDGMIVFEDAIDSEHLDTLNDRMVKDVDDLVSRAGTHFK